MKNVNLVSIWAILMAGLVSCEPSQKAHQEEEQVVEEDTVSYLDEPLVTDLFTADPSAHNFGGKLYIYPSHDIKTDIADDDTGDQYAMEDYHVYSMDKPGAKVVDHGEVLHVKDVKWAKKQMWAPDAAEKDGKYYLYFPAKDQEDIFRIGVAVSDAPTGPFVAEPEAIKGTFSMDPAVFQNGNGEYYLYWGGIWGGQLQKWRTGEYFSSGDDPYADEPKEDEPAIAPKVAKLASNMVELAEAPKDVLILDAEGEPIKAGDHDRRFFEAAWVHKHGDRYYFSYSTGDTHKIVYATGDNPYGPFTYQGIILHPVQGWTNHHSIVEFEGEWYIFYHDTEISGKNNLRNIKMHRLEHREDGSIVPTYPLKDR